MLYLISFAEVSTESFKVLIAAGIQRIHSLNLISYSMYIVSRCNKSMQTEPVRSRMNWWHCCFVLLYWSSPGVGQVLSFDLVTNPGIDDLPIGY
jgi:hypothetical protein